ncbi:Hsp70 family protein [Planctomycetota bacterium]
MTERGSKAVGIDLGTSYSSLAYMDAQMTPRVVSGSDGQTMMPSAVYFGDEGIVVGAMALQQARLGADRLVQGIGRHMGDIWRREYLGRVYTPESISAMILGQLVKEAEMQIGPIRSAVITVPAYFTEKRRRATQQAGEIAGLEVIGILNETSAAVLADGLHRTDREDIVLVYNLGGGTFDVTVVQIAPNSLVELATNGNRQLGSRDWDNALMAYAAEDFQRATGQDLRADAQAMYDLWLECESAKRQLSRMSKTSIRLNAGGCTHKVELTRLRFEEITAHLLQATKLTTEMTLADAGLDWTQVSRVVLVGGGTYIPAVREMLATMAGKSPDTGVNPILAVVLGAAIYGYMLESGAGRTTEVSFRLPESVAGQKAEASFPLAKSAADQETSPPSSAAEMPSPMIRFVTAHGVGLKVRTEVGWKNEVLIPKNTQVPVSITKRFITSASAGEGQLRIEITQGDTTDLPLAEHLGTCRITGLPPDASSGEPVDVTMGFDEQGRLYVRASYGPSSQELVTALDVSDGLRPEEVEEHRRVLAGLLAADFHLGTADRPPGQVTVAPVEEVVNPYVVGKPVTGDMFVGRRDILRLIEINLLPSAGKNILVLRGQRRTGKTSVLLHLRETLADKSREAYIPVFIDLQGMTRVQDEGQFLYRFAYHIWKDLQKHDVDVRRPTAADFAKAPTDVFELDFLDRVERALGAKRLFLMLDEFEKIKGLIDQGAVSESILEYYRHLMQHSRLLFLIAGTQKLRELTGGYWSVFFNLALPVDIGTLQEAEARWLITEPVRRWYVIEPPAVDEIVQIAGCHPYFTQLVCKTLTDVRNERRLEVVNLQAVSEAVNRALQSGDEQIGYPWTEPDCTPEERVVLAVLAGETAASTSIPATAVQRRLDEAHAPFAFTEVAERLKARGVLSEDDDGWISFVVPLFRKWITRKQYDTAVAAAQYNAGLPPQSLDGGLLDV